MFEVNIDFDDASRCWRENKIQIKNGMFEYAYRCSYVHSTGKHCRKRVYQCIVKNRLSDMHANFEYDVNIKYKYHPNRHIFCKKHLNRSTYQLE